MTTTPVGSRACSRLTDRRIVLATGGPEGKHMFTLLAILDYTTPADPVPETGLAAYKREVPPQERLPHPMKPRRRT